MLMIMIKAMEGDQFLEYTWIPTTNASRDILKAIAMHHSMSGSLSLKKRITIMPGQKTKNHNAIKGRPNRSVNSKLIRAVARAERIMITGQSQSRCVDTCCTVRCFLSLLISAGQSQDHWNENLRPPACLLRVPTNAAQRGSTVSRAAVQCFLTLPR